MSDSENETTQPAQPVFPPIDATKAVPPVTPFPAWTWNTPVIPQFYWNVYSSEQRIRQICVEIGRIQAYLEYFAANSNAAHWYLDSRFTQVEARLTARVDKLEKRLGEEVAKLDKALADETTNRVNGDTALQAQIDTTKSALEAETAAREAGDKANADAIAKETADRKAGDAALRTDVDANTKAITKETADRKAGDAELRADVDANTAAIAQETADRKAGDAALRTDTDANKAAIAKETADRKAGDDQLADDLATETNARENEDTALGGRIDAEATARRDADTHLGEQIAAEHTERTHDVRTLTTAVNRRPLATAITAKPGSGVTVEATESDDGTGTGVAIGSTWQGDFDTMRDDLTAETTARADADSALEARLNAETDERRHDDTELGRRIDGKLAFGAVRAGDGITVTNDPDTTTATVSAEVTKARLDEAIAGIPGYELPAATADRLGGVKVGTGLAVTDDGTLTATGAPGSAGDSESVKVVYPQSTQDALGADNTSGKHSVGAFLNLFAGVDANGLPAARFNVKYVEVTKGHYVADQGSDFDGPDFKPVAGGVFDGCYVLTAQLTHLLNTSDVFGPGRGGSIAAIVHAMAPGDIHGEGCMLIGGSTIKLFLRPRGGGPAALAQAFNEADDTFSMFGLYCVEASIPGITEALDIHGND